MNDSLDLTAMLRDAQAFSLRRTDADRLSFLDGHRVYLEIGRPHDEKSGYIVYSPAGEGMMDGWETYFAEGRSAYKLIEDRRGTLREALDDLMRAMGSQRKAA